jgi:hypothetical protein
MINVTGVLAQIAVIQREIISPDTLRACKAYGNIPLTMAAAQMPCFVNFPSPLQSNTLVGSDEMAREFWEVRDYRMVLYHSPLGAGTSEEKSGLLVPYFELVYSKFGSYPHLKGIGGVVDAIIVSDTGTGTSGYVGNMYYAIGFTLRVTTRVRRLVDDID